MNYFKLAKKIIIGIMGLTIVLIGVVFLLLPGPGTLVIILGLIILAGQFVIARHILNELRKDIKKTKKFIKRRLR